MGEEWAIYVWPSGHVEGDPFPEDFFEQLTKGLKSVGIAWEPA